ncbi:hypothetical protein DAEQUDRAFT_274031 [Daedalea quercina L-15889]|uniref:F-box domain-containing protein n=1 Tax=Daedalea quercina L-15889 TaxID=1314783 RepID=A0A165QE74_9APHY|nr:hypothetical protein DAEQUDRAFT_274031 [Daedalea quercina L-15889]
MPAIFRKNLIESSAESGTLTRPEPRRRGRIPRLCDAVRYLFNEGTRTSTVVHLELRKLPIEIWWRIIDCFQHDWGALLECSLVCQAWHVRTQEYLPASHQGAVELYGRKDVVRFSQFVRGHSIRVRAIRVLGDHHSGSFTHLGTFAALLCGQRSQQLEELHLISGVWKAATMNASTLFRHLTTLATIRRLRLHDITLPSTTIFARLLFSLPNLYFLRCTNVSTRNKCYGGALHKPRSSPYHVGELVLDCPEGDDLFYLITMAGLARYSHTVEVAIHSATHVRVIDGPPTNYERFAQELTIAIYDAERSSVALMQCLSMMLRYCVKLETLRIKVAPRTNRVDEISFLYAIPSSVTSHVPRIYIAILLNQKDSADDQQPLEEVLWARFEYRGGTNLAISAPRRAIVHFRIPSWVFCTPSFDKTAWIEQIRHHLMSTEMRVSDLRAVEAATQFYMVYHYGPSHPQGTFVLGPLTWSTRLDRSTSYVDWMRLWEDVFPSFHRISLPEATAIRTQLSQSRGQIQSARGLKLIKGTQMSVLVRRLGPAADISR